MEVEAVTSGEPEPTRRTARTSWRRHEIAGRLQELENRGDKEKLTRILTRIEKLLDKSGVPIVMPEATKDKPKVNGEKKEKKVKP